MPEQFLQLDAPALHTGDFGDGHHHAPPVGQSRLLHDDVDAGRDVLTHDGQWQIQPCHQHHRLQASQRIPGGIGVQSGQGAFVPGIHGRQHVEGLGAAALPDHDPVRPHAQRIAHQFADIYAPAPLLIGWPGLERHQMFMAQP